jgi:hypothetical protein
MAGYRLSLVVPSVLLLRRCIFGWFGFAIDLRLIAGLVLFFSSYSAAQNGLKSGNMNFFLYVRCDT